MFIGSTVCTMRTEILQKLCSFVLRCDPTDLEDMTLIDNAVIYKRIMKTKADIKIINRMIKSFIVNNICICNQNKYKSCIL